MTSFDDDDIISVRSRRRCVKGRVSYLESDNLGPALSEEIDLNEEHSNNLEIPADPDCNETLETEEYDGEPVTIDLSEFLSETALLAEALAENPSESTAAVSDCHSQFRVTSSKTDPPLCPVSDLPSLKELNLNEKNVPSEGSSCTLPVNPSSAVRNVLTSSSTKSSDPGEENIPLEKNTLSPTVVPLEVSISKTSMGESNACKTVGEATVAKEVLENTAVEALGKFPIVRCEKLNMDNFVKKNAIKVGNWPLPKVSNTPKTKLNMSKNSSVKKPRSVNPKTPKLFNKPITFNKLVPKNSIGASTNMVRSILVNPFELKPSGVTYSIGNSNVHRFVSSHTPVRTCLNEYSVGGKSIIKVVSKNVMSECNSFTQMKKFPIITSVNKIGGPSKTLKIISPKKISPAVAEHKNVGVTPILPKPVIETITSPVLLNETSYTVIEPYVDDPTSPVRPKPILTVPLEVIPAIEDAESNELTHNGNELTLASKVSSKHLKSSRSVFLNGAIKQTSILSRHKKEPIPRGKSILTENNLVKVDTVLQNTSDSDIEESMSINKAKTAVVDAMTSVFSKPSKRQIKSKQNNKDSQNLSAHVADSSMFGCQSYNNSLNDILFGFGSVELMDENMTNEDVSSELSSPSFPKKVNKGPDVTLETQRKIVIKNKNQKTPSIISSYPEHIFDDDCADSDTLSASECGDDSDKSVLKMSETKKQKKHSKALRTKIKRGKRLSHNLEPDENEEYTFCKTPDLSTKKSQKENSIPQLSDNELEYNGSKNVSTNIKKEANIEKPSSKDMEGIDTVSLRKNTKETRVSSRGKRKPSNDSVNNIIKQEPNNEPSEVNSKKPVKTGKGSLHFIHSRFKRNAKAKQSIKVAKRVRKQLSKPSDIIQEIKTITSGNSMVQKGKKISKENILNTSDSVVINPLSKSSVKHHKRKVKSIRPKSKKKIKTLKVLFKRSKQKQNSDNESQSSSLKEEISKSGSPCKENIPDLPCEKVSENPNSSVSCEEITIPSKLPEEIFPVKLKESEVMVSNLSNQSNHEIQNSEIKAMQDIEESGKLEPIAPEESTDPNNSLRSLDGDASSTLREELCSERVEVPTELVSGVSGQNNPEIVNSECEVENNKDESGSTINHSVYDNKSDPKDGLRSEDFSVKSISGEDICSNCIEEPELPISNDSSCSNLELLNSETKSMKDSNLVNTGSGDADLTVSGENTVPNSGSSLSLDTDKDLALRKESLENPKSPVSSKLDLTLELKNSDEKGIDNECHKISLTVPDESMDPNNGLKFPLDACTSVDGNTDANISNNSLVEPNGVSVILNESKDDDSSDHREEEQDHVKSKVMRKRKKKRKSCPKLKISKTMPDPESAGVKNWYVSERKASTDSAEFEQNSSKSSLDQNSKVSPEMPEVLQTKNASDSHLELSGLNSEVLKPRTKISIDNSLKSAPVNDNISSEAVTDSNLEAVPTLEPPLHGNPSTSNESSLSLASENKSEMHSSNSVISACDKASNSNSIEVEKTEPDHNVKVFPPNSPKNSKEKKKAIIENHVVEELTSPETSKTEPLDLDESTDQHFDQNIVDAGKEDQNIAQDKESDSTPLPTVRRRGRPKKNPPKSMDTKAKKSQPVPGCGTAEIILNKGKKRRSKITSYFTPQASKSVELTAKPMESVPVPVEITSVPEVVTPKGATLPVETSVAAALETMPSGSTRPPATSLKVACADTTCSEKIFPDATCVEDIPLNRRPTPLDVASEELTAAPPPKATTPQDATCVEESQSNANSIPKSPVEETSMDDAPAKASTAPALALAPKDATCKEKTPDANSSTESPMEETSVNVAPAKTPVALAQSTSRPFATSSNTPSNRGRKRKFCPEAVQVPFSMGWMREMVHRANEGHKVGQKVSDIYYFSPEGIKLRSMVEIGNYLSKHSECTLTLDHFTFARELVFHEPLEIERSAKQASSLPKFYKTKILDRSREMDAAMQKSPMKKFAPPLPSIPKLTIKNVNQGQVKKFTCVLGESSSNSKKSEGEVGLRKNSQVCLESNNAPSAKKARISIEKQLNSVKDSLKVKSHSQSLTSGNSGRTFDVSSKKDKPDIAQIRSTFKQKLSESKTANSTAVQSRAKLKSKSLLPKKVETFHRPCSYHCAVARYQIPSVRCALCLCLFHPHCVPSITKGIGYACKSCVSAKLALYETIRNPKIASEDSNEEDRDMPFDIDASILYPVMQLKVFKKELKIFSSSFGNAANPGNLSICGIANPAPPMPVPYMPCLVTHLLRPPSPLQGPKQIAPKSISPMLPAQQLHQKGGNSVLPDRISANAPASSCRPILVRCSPSGRTVIHNGLVVNAPLNTNPLNALKNLTHDISHSGKWSAVSSSPLNSNFGTQSFSLKKNSVSSDLNELPPKFQNTSVPSRVKNSILAASLSGRIPEDSDITQVNQPTLDENGLLTNHDCLKPIFKMLDICDLLRVGQVCKSWNHLSTQSFLWEKISFSNLMVTSWIDCCFFLRKADTKSIDFQDIVHPDQEGPFKSLEDYISILSNVEEVIFDQIPSHLLQSVVLNLHQLRKLECHFVTDAVNEQEIWNSSCTFKLSSLQGLNRLTKLKINSGGGIILKCDPEYLMPFLPNLRHLTLTGFKFSSHINLECLSMHKELISLELGDCSDIEPEVYVLLESLTKLRCLRLENGGSLEDIGLVKCLQKMTRLEMLELMNFKIPNNFEEAFQQFQQLIHLNIWPDTSTEGPLINKNLLQAISHCKDLSYACWGIITEGEDAPDTLEIRNHENETEELNNEELFHKLVKLFPECRVEVKFVPRKSWKEFCSVRD